MQFVYPWFLVALAAVAIPIVIHLFHFRRYKKIVFSDLRFLKQVQEQAKSKQKLKDLLILISRILTIIFAVLAFAQPFLPSQHSLVLKGQKAISIFIDNSFSMNGENAEGTMLEDAKNRARAIVNSYGADDQFQIITHDREGRHQRLVNKTDALAWIDEIKTTSASALLSDILNNQKQALEQAGNHTRLVYWVSDFQERMCNINTTEPDSSLLLNLLPVAGNSASNLSIDSVWLTRPAVQVNTLTEVYVRIRNHGTSPAENIPVTFTLNGQQKGLQNITCEANQFKDVLFTVTLQTTELAKGEFRLLDNPITFDDNLYFCLTPAGSSAVLCINGSGTNTYIRTLFAGETFYRYTEVSQNNINYAAFADTRCILLNEPTEVSSGLADELVKFVAAGGQLVVIPAVRNGNNGSLNSLLQNLKMPLLDQPLKQQLSVSSLQGKDALFKDVFRTLPQNMDLPKVSNSYVLKPTANTRGKALMELNNGSAFIWQGAYLQGNVVVSAVPLNAEWSNLQQHAVFVPLMLKLGTGKPQPEPLYYTIGNAHWIQLNQAVSGDKLITLKGKQTELALQTVTRNGKTTCLLDQPVELSGWYELTAPGSAKPLQAIALNFNRNESDLKTWDKDAMQQFLESRPGARLDAGEATVLQQHIQADLNGTSFWRLCILLALVFVGIEILLLRILK
jgi:hypothetical protein